jgi:hypothetical protein
LERSSSSLLALDARAFGDDAHRVAGGVAGLVLGQQRQQHVEIGRHFGDDGAVDLGEEAGSRAVSPLRRPNSSTTPIRSWLSTVVRSALIASTERLTAVEKPMQ